MATALLKIGKILPIISPKTLFVDIEKTKGVQNSKALR